ncbi:hypothetical protein JWJ88_17270 [Paracoccus methylovorus]|uniref:Uncharacterized protein n=1 Tax=Paracoccus methylovorus TaxID=2812658 RepID=A0ABX7JKT4_9RHOB|nr:hypothetical protein [Paracoccus methylovorus]QRZ14715.1 hypothetical protein JWJ88_17270 [Paracoccus methylovorus]
MTAPSAKPLFRAIRSKRIAVPVPALFGSLPVAERPARADARRAEDFYPTGQPEAIRGLLARDGDRIRACDSVWEPACGDGALVREIRGVGIPCCASDLIDRGCPDSWQADFYSCLRSLGKAIITNPPYCEINARDGHGRWLRHTLDMPGWDYLALLLSWDWPAARANGLGALLEANPFSYCYLMRWKLDFTGEGSPPQRNAWFVWIRDWPEVPMQMRFMDRKDGDSLMQEDLI